MGLGGFQPSTSRAGTGRCPSRSDKAKTAFRTSSGQLYEFNQVPFGLCNAPATFSRLMDRVLAGLHWETCLFYLDDIIVFSSTLEEYLARLRQVFERLRHAKLKLGADKCTFAAKEVSYLGHRVTEEGLLPDSSLLAAIREILHPKTATEVRSFLGLAGYYRRYVKNFAAVAGPLHAHQEGRGLPLERQMPGRLRQTQKPTDNQPHHCLPGFQPSFQAIYRRLHRWPRCYPGSSPRWQRTHHLLHFQSPQPG